MKIGTDVLAGDADRRDSVLVLAGDPVGLQVAIDIDAGDVIVVGTNPAIVERASPHVERTAYVPDGTDVPSSALDVDAAVLAHQSDSLNFLYSARLRSDGIVDDPVIRVTDPDREDAFAGVPGTAVCTTNVVARELVSAHTERPELTEG